MTQKTNVEPGEISEAPKPRILGLPQPNPKLVLIQTVLTFPNGKVGIVEGAVTPELFKKVDTENNHMILAGHMNNVCNFARETV